MGTYNENLRSTAIDSLLELQLEQKKGRNGGCLVYTILCSGGSD